MKYIGWLLMTLAVVGCASSSLLNKATEKALKKQLNQLLEVAGSGKIEDMASMMIYSGDDESRKWKEACNPTNEEERFMAQQGVDFFKDTFGATPNYKVTAFETESSPEGTYYVMIVTAKE